MLFSEAIEKFTEWRTLEVKAETAKSYDLILRSFCLFLRDPEIEEIGVDDVVEWFKLQERLRWDRNGFIPKAMAVRKILEFYVMNGLEVLNPDLVPVPDKEYRKPRILSEENYKKLLSAIPKDGKDPRHIRNEAVIRLLWDCGARNSEICSLDVGDIDFQEMKALIRTEKAKTRVPMRQIYWTESTNEALRIWMDRRDRLLKRGYFKGDAFFISIGGRKYGERIQNAGVGEMLRRYSNKAGIIPIANAHSFRHHFGQDLAEQDANNSTISSMMGHSCLASSYVYTMLTDQSRERAYRKFHPGDQSFGELPSRRLDSSEQTHKKWKKTRNRTAERAALKIKREKQQLEYITRKKEPCRAVIGA